MNENLKKQLQSLAQKYEIPSFCDADPSQFLRWYKVDLTIGSQLYNGEDNTIGHQPSMGAGTTIDSQLSQGGATVSDVETASFIAAMLAFGNRKQFIPKISYILELADKTSGSITKWITSGTYKTTFSKSEKKFYRFYSYNDMHDFFGDLAVNLTEGNINLSEGAATQSGRSPSPGQTWGALGESIRFRWERALAENDGPCDKIILADIISAAFPNSAIVPKGKNTANKRIHMFLRWMVRQGSPVDLGLWKWYSPSELLIPLDVHVMVEGVRLGALPENARATRKTAIALTQSLKEIWPEDPCRGDFALFGLGVDEKS